MIKFFEYLIKGAVGFVWLTATFLTSLLLAPFVISHWLSGRIDKKQEQHKQSELIWDDEEVWERH